MGSPFFLQLRFWDTVLYNPLARVSGPQEDSWQLQVASYKWPGLGSSIAVNDGDRILGDRSPSSSRRPNARPFWVSGQFCPAGITRGDADDQVGLFAADSCDRPKLLSLIQL